jgi:hypothetical protein
VATELVMLPLPPNDLIKSSMLNSIFEETSSSLFETLDNFFALFLAQT